MKNNRNTIWNAAYNVYFKIYFHPNTKRKHDAVVTWLNILLIRRTTLSNQSINQSIKTWLYVLYDNLTYILIWFTGFHNHLRILRSNRAVDWPSKPCISNYMTIPRDTDICHTDHKAQTKYSVDINS